jgi:hypothetical protein
MSLLNFVCASLCLTLVSCGQSKKSDDEPVNTEATQALNDRSPASPQENADQPIFSSPKYTDVIPKLEDAGCRVDQVEGVTSCPEPKTLDEADSLYVLLATFKEGMDIDATPTLGYNIRNTLETSVKAEILKVTESSFIKPLKADTDSQLGSFKVECMFSFDETLGFQKRSAGISLMRDLCGSPEFIGELTRLKVGVRLGGLVLSDENRFRLSTTFTRLKIDANASKANVMEFLAEQSL